MSGICIFPAKTGPSRQKEGSAGNYWDFGRHGHGLLFSETRCFLAVAKARGGRTDQDGSDDG